ncbi:MAG: glycerol-3-phosphate dehydrogenase/oxidase [Chloroflexi bacterium]|nr:glycerol-3-phosphate dehydrogenase/oxidase [Chloroflexota bacterium]
MANRTVTKEEVTRKLDQLPPENLAEVDQYIDFLRYKTSLSARFDVSASQNEHPAFGLWADRVDIDDTAEYAQKLRNSIEKRHDAHPSH